MSKGNRMFSVMITIVDSIYRCPTSLLHRPTISSTVKQNLYRFYDLFGLKGIVVTCFKTKQPHYQCGNTAVEKI